MSNSKKSIVYHNKIEDIGQLNMKDLNLWNKILMINYQIPKFIKRNLSDEIINNNIINKFKISIKLKI